jgi:uncharacterized protein YuzE
MKVTYDVQADALYIELKDLPVGETDELSPGIVADYDSNGNIIGIEVLAASKRVTLPQRVEHDVVLSSNIGLDHVAVA